MTLARNYGFGINGDAFEQWAYHLPLRAVDHHRDDLFRIEAIFLGQAGLLELNTIPERYQKDALNDGYFSRLRNEYLYLSHKFSLQPMDYKQWRFLRLRPQNFPHIRISQLANLYYNRRAGLSQLLEASTVKEAKQGALNQRYGVLGNPLYLRQHEHPEREAPLPFLAQSAHHQHRGSHPLCLWKAPGRGEILRPRLRLPGGAEGRE